MTARFASQAEYYRHHRRCFELAIEMGVTPREAECEIARREARDRWSEAETKLRAIQSCGRIAMPDGRPSSDDRGDARDGQPWMMRD